MLSNGRPIRFNNMQDSRQLSVNCSCGTSKLHICCSGAGEPSLHGVGGDWSSVHLEFIWRQQRLQLRFQVTSLASWSCRRTTHQHQSTRLYCHRVHVTWPSHVSTIWLRVGEAEQEERVSVCWRWSSATSNSRPPFTIQSGQDRSHSKWTNLWQRTKLSNQS